MRTRWAEAVLTSTNNLVWAEIWKISEPLSENFHFLVVKFSVHLNRLVFVMPLGGRDTKGRFSAFLYNGDNIFTSLIVFAFLHTNFLLERGLMDRIYSLNSFLFITKTCLYNFDPLKPHFCIVKLGFTGVYIIFFSYFCSKHRLWVLVRTASPRRS